jgi:hypothetical protein
MEKDAMNAVKHDEGKVPLHLLPSEAIIEIAKVLGHGAVKYGDHNWRKGFRWSRLIGALLRHIFAFIGGQDKDEESGLPHLAHAGCCLLFLLTHQLQNLGEDDRYKKQ